jgi:urease accessory protein
MSLPRGVRRVAFLLISAAAFAGMMAVPAAAHVAAIADRGWNEGFAHPFSGVDHLAAMVAVGLWASQLGQPALLLLPLSFLASMALGAAASFAGLTLPIADDGVAVSVAILGVLLVVAARPRLRISAALVAAFGVMHGASHAAEMPRDAAPLLYGLGFSRGHSDASSRRRRPRCRDDKPNRPPPPADRRRRHRWNRRHPRSRVVMPADWRCWSA